MNIRQEGDHFDREALHALVDGTIYALCGFTTDLVEWDRPYEVVVFFFGGLGDAGLHSCSIGNMRDLQPTISGGADGESQMPIGCGLIYGTSRGPNDRQLET